jgi:hypothetical protein
MRDPAKHLRVKGWEERPSPALEPSAEERLQATWHWVTQHRVEGELVLIQVEPTVHVLDSVETPELVAERARAAALEARVRKLEQQVAELVAERRPTHEGDPHEGDPAPDPHFAWIASHREELRAYPSGFVALDPEKGIVLHSTDDDDFAAQLEKLPSEERERLMAFHTSMFI